MKKSKSPKSTAKKSAFKTIILIFLGVIAFSALAVAAIIVIEHFLPFCPDEFSMMYPAEYSAPYFNQSISDAQSAYKLILTTIMPFSYYTLPLTNETIITFDFEKSKFGNFTASNLGYKQIKVRQPNAPEIKLVNAFVIKLNNTYPLPPYAVDSERNVYSHITCY